MIVFDNDFPLEDVNIIRRRIIDHKCLVPGFIPGDAGLISLESLFYNKQFENRRTVLLVDRNLASRMAKIASEGPPVQWDKPTDIAINLMAFAQAMDIDIEPGIAYHELAHKDGDHSAHAELSWFRAADRGAAKQWIDLAMRRTKSVDLGFSAPLEEDSLSYNLNRWTRNYIVMLKVAHLALENNEPLYSILALLDWMIKDFILAGPAFLYAARYFSPLATKRKGMLKDINSPICEETFNGIKNATWDTVYLSIFVEKVNNEYKNGVDYVFATADIALADVARNLTISDNTPGEWSSLLKNLKLWWPDDSAQTIFSRYLECIEIVATDRNRGADQPRDYLETMISQREAALRTIKPPPI